MIRTAREEDAKRLLEIYGSYIETPVTFAYELPEETEFQQKIREVLREYPYLVWEEEGRILGYAYAHRLRPMKAYDRSAELTIYVDREARGRGIGRELYQRLMEELKVEGIRMVYGCVTRPNPPSERLHLSLGFTLTGVFHKAGWKNKSWHDVSWFEKDLGESV